MLSFLILTVQYFDSFSIGLETIDVELGVADDLAVFGVTHNVLDGRDVLPKHNWTRDDRDKEVPDPLLILFIHFGVALYFPTGVL